MHDRDICVAYSNERIRPIDYSRAPMVVGLLAAGVNCPPMATQPQSNDALIKTAANLYRDSVDRRQDLTAEQVFDIIWPLPSEQVKLTHTGDVICKSFLSPDVGSWAEHARRHCRAGGFTDARQEKT